MVFGESFMPMNGTAEYFNFTTTMGDDQMVRLSCQPRDVPAFDTAFF
jgi:hypothetical protein